MAENFQNFYVTKLREACDASATTIYVDNPPNFSEGTLVLEFSNSTKHEMSRLESLIKLLTVLLLQRTLQITQ